MNKLVEALGRGALPDLLVASYTSAFGRSVVAIWVPANPDCVQVLIDQPTVSTWEIIEAIPSWHRGVATDNPNEFMGFLYRGKLPEGHRRKIKALLPPMLDP